MRALWILVASLLWGAAAADTPEQVPSTSSERCTGMFKANGKETIQALPSVRVMDADPTAPFVLPADAPPNVSLIFCARNTLIPAKYDYKVLLAGFPLAIVTPDNRKAVLELSPQNLILYRMIQGKSSSEEDLLVRESLRANQQLLTKSAGK